MTGHTCGEHIATKTKRVMARKSRGVQLSVNTVILIKAIGDVVGPGCKKALRAWAKLPPEERKAPIEYLEQEAADAVNICAHGDEYAVQWKRENDRVTALLRALGEALGLP